MELIKKIKQAEAEAKEIVEKARVKAGQIADASAAERSSKFEEADALRRQSIESAVADAEQAGQGEVKTLTNRETGKKQGLVDGAKQKMDAAVNKIVAAIK